jgi:tetratricopeptide (TPR) repeat protein
MFSIAAFILYIHYRKEGKTSALLASAFFFLLAVLSGQSALVFPVIILAYELAVKPRQRTKLLLYTGSLALCFSAFWSFFGGLGEFHPAGGFETGRLFDSLSALGYYVGKLAFPVNLNLLPGIPENPLLLFVALIPLVLAAVLYTEGRKTGAFLAAWIPVTILPALLVVMAGVEFPIGERYLYLPSVGACMLLAFFAGGIRNKRVLAACFIPIVAFWISDTSGRVQTWGSDTAIWEDTALKGPDQVLPRIHQGISLIKAGRQAEGKEAFKAALGNDGITQDNMLLIAKVLHNAGGQDGDKALLENLVQARGSAQAYYGLGFIYYRLYSENEKEPGLLGKSIKYLEKAVAVSSDFMRPHYYLGLCYLEANDWQRAEEHLRIARQLDIDGQYRAQTADFLTLINETRKRGL